MTNPFHEELDRVESMLVQVQLALLKLSQSTTGHDERRAVHGVSAKVAMVMGDLRAIAMITPIEDDDGGD